MPSRAEASSHRQLRLPSGQVLAWTEYGDPAGAPVLYHHGWPGSRLEARFAHEPAIALGLRIIAPDRPGYGASTQTSTRTLGDWPADAAALVDHLGVHRFVALGISGGAPYALACAAALPGRVTRVCIVSAMGPVDGNEALRNFDPGAPARAASGRATLAVHARPAAGRSRAAHRSQRGALRGKPRATVRTGGSRRARVHGRAGAHRRIVSRGTARRRGGRGARPRALCRTVGHPARADRGTDPPVARRGGRDHPGRGSRVVWQHDSRRRSRASCRARATTPCRSGICGSILGEIARP